MNEWDRMDARHKILEDICRITLPLSRDEEAIRVIAEDLCNRLRTASWVRTVDEAWLAELDAATGTAVAFINWCVMMAETGSLRGEGASVAYELGALCAKTEEIYDKGGFTGEKPFVFSMDSYDLGASLLPLPAAHWLRLCELFSIPVQEKWATLAELGKESERLEAEREAAAEAARKAERTPEWYENLTAQVVEDALESGKPINASSIQRRYGVGFLIACRILDAIEASGCAEKTNPESNRKEFRALRKYR